jgi:hypothetical protein
MTSSKNAVVLVVISFLLVILIYSSVAKFDVFAKPRKTSITCTSTNTSSTDYTEKCCWYEWNDDPNQFTGAVHMCQVCEHVGDYAVYCDPPYAGSRTAAPPVSGLPPSAGSAQPPSGNNTGGITNGQTGPPNRLGTFFPSTNNSGGITNGQMGLPSRLGNALPPVNNASTSFNPRSTIKTPPTSTFSPATTGNVANPGNNNNNTSTPPALSITKEHNLASPKLYSPPSQKQQTSTTTCPNGLLSDANGNCPSTPNTSSTNQQGGLTSNNNNNPTSGHHKGSNQPTQTGGGQELTAIKKHKGSKTDQGTTQPPS